MSQTPDEEDGQFPDTVIITRDGLMCKCGHAPMDHEEEDGEAYGCSVCRCEHGRGHLTPHPHGSIAARILPDGTLATLYQEAFGFRILIGPADCMVGGDVYVQYNQDAFRRNVTAAQPSHLSQMLTLFQEWDGFGYPGRWYRVRIGSNEYLYNTPDGKQPQTFDVSTSNDTEQRLLEMLAQKQAVIESVMEPLTGDASKTMKVDPGPLMEVDEIKRILGLLE